MNAPDFAEVLGRHDGWDYGGPGVIECEGCGWKSERLGPEWNGRKEERHRAHVAAAVLAEVRAWLESEGAVAIEEAFLGQLPSKALSYCAQEDINAGLDAWRERLGLDGDSR